MHPSPAFDKYGWEVSGICKVRYPWTQVFSYFLDVPACMPWWKKCSISGQEICCLIEHHAFCLLTNLMISFLGLKFAAVIKGFQNKLKSSDATLEEVAIGGDEETPLCNNPQVKKMGVWVVYLNPLQTKQHQTLEREMYFSGIRLLGTGVEWVVTKKMNEEIGTM